MPGHANYASATATCCPGGRSDLASCCSCHIVRVTCYVNSCFCQRPRPKAGCFLLSRKDKIRTGRYRAHWESDPSFTGSLFNNCCHCCCCYIGAKKGPLAPKSNKGPAVLLTIASSTHTHTHIHFTALWTLSRIAQASRHQKDKTKCWSIFTMRRICLCPLHGVGYSAVSVCLSVTSQYSVKIAEWIELTFNTEATLGLAYVVM